MRRGRPQSGNSAYLVWHNDRDPANREVYYRHTPNGGASWEAEEQVSSGAAGDSSTPLDAVTPGYAHVIWLDNRGGTYQYDYRRRAISAASPDAGVPDASSAPDAGARGDASVEPVDASVPGPDASTALEGGATSSETTGDSAGAASGCGCRTSRGETPAWLPSSLLLLVLCATRRRREAGIGR